VEGIQEGLQDFRHSYVELRNGEFTTFGMILGLATSHSPSPSRLFSHYLRSNISVAHALSLPNLRPPFSQDSPPPLNQSFWFSRASLPT